MVTTPRPGDDVIYLQLGAITGRNTTGLTTVAIALKYLITLTLSQRHRAGAVIIGSDPVSRGQLVIGAVPCAPI